MDNNQGTLLLMGNKEVFGIELHSEDRQYEIGVVQFWIDKHCIGKNEKTFIIPNLLAFSRINDLSQIKKLDIRRFSPKKIYRAILKSEHLYTKTLLGFGETFDEYVLRLYKYDSNAIFLWKYTNVNSYKKGSFRISKKRYNSIEVHSAAIDYKLFLEIIENWKKLYIALKLKY